MNKGKFAIKRDGKVKEVFDTFNEAFGRLHQLQPQSVDWAMKYEGWSIEEI